MDLKNKIDLGTAIFGNTNIDTGASRSSAEVVSDAVNGEVDVIMKDEEGNDQVVTISCDGDLRTGDSATILIQDGVATAISAGGAGERSRQETETAQNTANTAAADAVTAKNTAEQAATDAASAADKAQQSAETATAAKSTAEQAADAASKAQETATAAATATEEEAKRAKAAEEDAKQAATDAAKDAQAAGVAASLAQSAADAAKDAADGVRTDFDENQKYFYHDSEGAHVVSGDSTDLYRLDLTNDTLYIRDGGAEVSHFTGDEVSLAKGKSVINANGMTLSDNDGTKLASFAADNVSLAKGNYTIGVLPNSDDDGMQIMNTCKYDFGTDYKGKSVTTYYKYELDYTKDGEQNTAYSYPLVVGIYEDGGSTGDAISCDVRLGWSASEVNIASKKINLGSINVSSQPSYSNEIDLEGKTINIGEIFSSPSTSRLYSENVNIQATATNINTDTGVAKIGNTSNKLTLNGSSILINTATSSGTTSIGNTNKTTSISGKRLNVNTSSGTVSIGNTTSQTTINGSYTVINNGTSSGAVAIGNQNNSMSLYGKPVLINSYGDDCYTVIGNTNSSLQLKGSEFTYNNDNVGLLAYPVNSVYLSSNSSAAPGTLFGGTWSSITTGISGVYGWKRTT